MPESSEVMRQHIIGLDFHPLVRKRHIHVPLLGMHRNDVSYLLLLPARIIKELFDAVEPVAGSGTITLVIFQHGFFKLFQ